MKKRGFTIIELLATVSIIAVLLIIVVPGFSFVRNNINQGMYENKVKLALTGAEMWAGETDYLVTNVGHLIESGKLEADNERGEYINPVDRSSMLCDVIRITKENGNYKGTLTQEQNCDYNDLADKNSMILLKKYDSNNQEILDESATKGWTNTDVTLKVEVKSEYPYENNIKEIKLTGNNTEEVRIVNKDFSSKNSFSVKANQLLNTRYNVEVTFDNEGKIIKYTNSTTVKIDKQRPTLYMDETSIDKESEWTNTKKKVTIRYSDGSGSGVYGYSISGNKDCKSVSYTKTNKNEGNVALGNGTYYICVRDNVRNYSEDTSSKSVVVKNVDTTSPVVNVVPSSAWAATNSAVISGTDSESGIIAYSVSKTNSPGEWIGVNNTKNFSVTKSDFTENGTYYAFLKDAVGNIGVKSFVINRIDKNPPSINVVPSTTWGATNFAVISGTDNESGVSAWSVSKTNSPGSWINVTNTKNFSVTKSDFTENGTYYAFLKDAVGNINQTSFAINRVDKNPPKINSFSAASSNGSYKTTNVNLSINASDETSMQMCVSLSGYGVGCSWENYTTSKTFNVGGSLDGGVRTIYLSVRDIAGNTTNKAITYQVYRECSSSFKTNISGWGSCNKTCGGGTQSRSYQMKDSYTGAVCSNNSESQACNTQECYKTPETLVRGNVIWYDMPSKSATVKNRDLKTNGERIKMIVFSNEGGVTRVIPEKFMHEVLIGENSDWNFQSAMLSATNIYLNPIYGTRSEMIGYESGMANNPYECPDNWACDNSVSYIGNSSVITKHASFLNDLYNRGFRNFYGNVYTTYCNGRELNTCEGGYDYAYMTKQRNGVYTRLTGSGAMYYYYQNTFSSGSSGYSTNTHSQGYYLIGTGGANLQRIYVSKEYNGIGAILAPLIPIITLRNDLKFIEGAGTLNDPYTIYKKSDVAAYENNIKIIEDKALEAANANKSEVYDFSYLTVDYLYQKGYISNAIKTDPRTGGSLGCKKINLLYSYNSYKFYQSSYSGADDCNFLLKTQTIRKKEDAIAAGKRFISNQDVTLGWSSTVTIKQLISSGYIQSDSNGDFYDYINNRSMLCDYVTSSGKLMKLNC